MQDLLTIRDWIRWGSSQFNAHNLYFGHGTDNAWDEAAVLTLWAIHQPWGMLDKVLDARLNLDECNKIHAIFERRIKERIPAAYLTGEAWFGGLKFKVTQDVLVPRSPIAELILDGFQPWLSIHPERILDLCSGSGCIGILCAKVFDCDVDLSDISKAALKVAKENINAHDLKGQVKAIKSDVFSDLEGRKYDLIVSNPPYVDARDIACMPDEYRAEPQIGLASGEDGLDITRNILNNAADHLSESGLLVVEVGNSWVALEEAFPQVPFFWPELKNGGHGVFMLTAEQLRELNLK